ncbi:unnamed protein product [Peronospora belbahrii]|uniref:Expansin-like EG45 domain-containing protein n=2 Tax=Peronospora belbahrii TaxID=622444 RepID=A0AAU9KXF7_9STRA|nr:unnamed protein product [Peronospora belbahrii]
MFRQVLLLTVMMPVMAFAGGDEYFTGDGTSYTLGNVSAGNCNFMYDPGVGENYAALNDEQWESTRNCGRCAEVSCDDSRCSDTTSTVIVYIVDRCPECVKGDLDLSPTVFKQLTGRTPDRYRMKWKFAECPVTGNIEYCTKTGSSSSWLAVQPANFASGVASMKIGNQDVTMVDSCYYFLLNAGMNINMAAVDIEITSVSGEVITETLPLSADNCTCGTSNFGSSGGYSSSFQITSTIESAPAPALLSPVPALPSDTMVTSTVTTPPATLPATPPKSVTEPSYTIGTPAVMAPPATLPLETPTSSTAFAPPYTPTDASSLQYQYQSQTQLQGQSEVTDSFTSLKTGLQSSGGKYEAGNVIAPNELGRDMNILQSNETGVETAHNVQQQDESDCTKKPGKLDIEHANTRSSSSDRGTSPVVVALIVLAVVGGITLAGVAYVVQKKKLTEKQIDQDVAMMRSFDNFSSPVRFDETIAKI